MKLNNRLGSRDTRHMNLLVAEIFGEQVVFQFTGETIPGIVQVVNTKFTKNGKWSYDEWTIELAEGVQAFVWTQDFGTGRYINAGTWDAAIADVRRIAGIDDLAGKAIERFIRANLPGAAEKLDTAAVQAKTDGAPALRELLEAQQALADAQREASQAQAEAQALIAEVEAAEKAKADAAKAKAEAAQTRQAVAKAKAAMAKGASLADLKAMLGGAA